MAYKDQNQIIAAGLEQAFEQFARQNDKVGLRLIAENPAVDIRTRRNAFMQLGDHENARRLVRDSTDIGVDGKPVVQAEVYDPNRKHSISFTLESLSPMFDAYHNRGRRVIAGHKRDGDEMLPGQDMAYDFLEDGN